MSLITLVGCTTDSVLDELDTQESDVDYDGKGDGSEAANFFQLHFNGGEYITRVNRSSLKCADNTYRAACEIDAVQWEDTSFTPAQQTYLEEVLHQSDEPGVSPVILRGRIAKRRVDLGGELATYTYFFVTEVWRSETGTPGHGVFVFAKRARSCTSPCEAYAERRLNSTTRADIARVDVSDLELGALEAPTLADLDGDGLVVAGERFRFGAQGTQLRGRRASAVYRKLEPNELNVP
ncbi:MAG: DUF6748 domain-containing protein [Kofleriaceae bacterium]